MRETGVDVSRTEPLREGKTPLSAKEHSERSGHVFISYSRQDTKVAEQIRSALEEDGFRSWMDHSVQGGAVWREEIKNALDASGAVVVLWSSNAVESPWVSHEASYSMASGIYVPCRIELIEIHAVYGHIQATDLFQTGDKLLGVADLPGYKRLVGQLDVLMPPPTPALVRLCRLLWSNSLSIVASLVALGAFWLLFNLSSQGRTAEIQRQETLSAIAKTTKDQIAAIDTARGKQVQTIMKTSEATAQVVREHAREASLERYVAMLLEDAEQGTGKAGRQMAAIALFNAGRSLPGTSNLRDAEFNYHEYPNKDFGGQCKLIKASFQHANLRKASLISADLTCANLRWADLHGAKLMEAKLEGADLRDAKLEGAALIGATSDASTRWPEGFDWEAEGVTSTNGDP